LSQYFSYNTFVFALRILGLNAAKEKLEIVSGAAPPPFRIFAGGFPRRRRRRNAFGLIQEYCTRIVLNFKKIKFKTIGRRYMF
jgi:hypothetical protein